MERNGFVKSHALGNDYIIVDPQTLSFPLTERAIRLICDRHFGVGSDGILTPAPSVTADFGLRIFNPDGSEAEKSGNGLRIFARYLYDHRLTGKPRLTVETAGGAGRPLASRSSGCAVAAAAVRKALVDRTLTIAMQGGDLQISVSPDWAVEMTGPAMEVYAGTLREPFLTTLETAG